MSTYRSIRLCTVALLLGLSLRADADRALEPPPGFKLKNAEQRPNDPAWGTILGPGELERAIARRSVDRAEQRGRAMSAHGAVATILGAVQLGVGGILVGVSISRTGDIAAFAGGLTLLPLGAIALTAGVPMWVYGKREERRATLDLAATGLRLTF